MEIIEKEFNEKKEMAGSNSPSRQSIEGYQDYRIVPVHDLVYDAYNGTGGFSGKTGDGFKSHIIAKMTENFYITRVQMSIYLPFFKKFINAKYKGIFNNKLPVLTFNESTKETIEDVYFNDFYENVTGDGTSYQAFSKNLLKNAYIADVSFCVIDQINGEINPYLSMVRSKDVLAYAVGEKKELVSLSYLLDKKEKENGDIVYTKKVVSVNEYAFYESNDMQQWNHVFTVPHSIGEIPVYAMFTERDEIGCFIPHPSTYNIVQFCAWIYDKGSKLDYVIDKQAHSLLAMQGNISQIASGIDNALVIGESEKSVFTPQFVSPDSSQIDKHLARIDSVVKSMFDIMAESGVSVSISDTKVESGIAKTYTFNAQDIVLKQGVVVLKEFDKWLNRLYKKFTNNNTNFTFEISYPNNFTPNTALAVQEIIDCFNVFSAENISVGKKEALKMLMSKLNPSLSIEGLGEFNNEIETALETINE